MAFTRQCLTPAFVFLSPPSVTTQQKKTHGYTPPAADGTDYRLGTDGDDNDGVDGDDDNDDGPDKHHDDGEGQRDWNGMDWIGLHWAGMG